MATIGSVAGSISIKPSRKGLLHKKLGVPQGEKIPASKLAKGGAKAKSTGDTALAKEVNFANNAKGWNKGGAKRKRPENYGQVKKKVAAGKY